MRAIIVVLTFAVSVIACGENAFRCVNPRGSYDDDWRVTNECMDDLDISDTCYCSHKAAYYADATGMVDEFKECCQDYGNYEAREC